MCCVSHSEQAWTLWGLSFACADDPWAVYVYHDRGPLHTASSSSRTRDPRVSANERFNISLQGEELPRASGGTSSIHNHDGECESESMAERVGTEL